MKMKNLLLGLILASIVASGQKTHAEAANGSPTVAGRAGIAEMLNYQGIKTKRIVASAAATSLHAGPGFLDAICPFGGTLGKYSLAYDTTGAPADSAVGQDVFTYVISPKVYTTNDSTSAQHGQMGCWYPPAPIKFVNGLYGRQSDSGHSTVYYVHCSDGTNPCVP